MKSFQDIIEHQLYVVEKNKELITSEEFHYMCLYEADMFRPPGEWTFSKYRDLATLGQKVGAGIASVITFGLYGLYRRATDRCRQRCKNVPEEKLENCISICNMNASKNVLDKIKEKKRELNDIEDPQVRAEAKMSLDAEEAKWVDRFTKYKDQVQATQGTAMMSFAYKKQG